ncbi:N-acetylmuramoyl-L-alanine amidase [Paenibacillus sp. FSL R7-0337]|uniref:N-acetylmuramoyl-L-alanine amidase n=1 Tax=Paenibacillus sp. FSL R7-0337 TaxID=1926588 RepID=UPI00096FAC99|nr:N-acetylmuramoyl-L-alanine amidase [Paenibacillus sp. FSL R7-0337]OMF96301.1 N-acetylmuramoyl-L-alanine amidase [Paenibacillus sp. FSL R7-0337]
MEYKGFILHHSRCPSINGKGFDFWVGLNGSVYAAPLLTDPEHIHICLEGNYGEAKQLPQLPERQQQLFAAGKLILELSGRYEISPLTVESHSETCPGAFFPWNDLVIYASDGYH